MRFTSLIVELVRARPRLMFWIVALFMAGLWIAVPMLLYRSPPGDVALTLAYGREYPLGTPFGPPLAFWLADIAFRLSGNSIFGVYLLSQACLVTMLWALFLLSRAIVGGQQAVIVILLTATIAVFSFPGVEFGPSVLAQPLWALLMLHAWQIAGQNRRSAWFALSIEAGLLLLATPAAAMLLLLLMAFFVATERGRRAIASLDPLFALLVVVVLALPYLIWLMRNDVMPALALPSIADVADRGRLFATLFGGLVLTLAGIALLSLLNTRYLARKPEEAPVIFRPPVDRFAKEFVFYFALAPGLAGSLVSAAFGFGKVFGGAGVALAMSGLAAVIVAGDLIYLRRQRFLRTVWLLIVLAPAVAVLGFALIQPWTEAGEVKTAIPAREMGRFFAENYQRRTNQPLRAVAGDPQFALLIGFSAPSRPRVFFDADPARSPWIDAARFNTGGGIVVWRAADTAGTPPADILARFPGLVPEVPRAFERLVNGRQPPLRIGWAIVRPKVN